MKKLAFSFCLFLLAFIVSAQSPCLSEGITFDTQEHIDSFQVNYPGCTEIEGDVIICGSNITSLNGLNVVTSIGGFLWINSTSLIGVTGLESLNSINGNLEIWDNYELTNISGLEKLTAINGSLVMRWNIALNSLEGLDNINAGTIEDLSINYNYLLTTCEVQSIVNYLASPNGVIDIFRNAPGCDNPPEIAEAGGVSIPCLPYGNYHFRNQSVIDSFQSDLPNCSELTGNVFIAGDNITNVDGLDNIESIEGDLIIWDCNYLTSISGLNSLSFIGEDLYIGINFILPSLTGLEGLNSIGGYLEIENNYDLTNLTGLDNLTSIGGHLEIRNNTGLTDLTGLNKLSSIPGDLRIHNNDALVDITAMDSLTFIAGKISIWTNDALTSLTGLENIIADSITDLIINENPNLSICEIQSVCDYLASPNGVVDIYENAYGCNSITEIAANCGISLSCLPYGNYYFNSQADIDDFQEIFLGCTELEGDVIISGSNITNLNGLSEITSIQGDLFINHNTVLTSLIGLNNLTSIGYRLSILYNDVLPNLSGLDNLNSIGESWLTIGYNPELTSLVGLNNLVTGVGALGIMENDILTSLTGIDNIEPYSVNLMEIYDNGCLTTCEVKSICDIIAIPGFVQNIHDNATGCNSPEEVIEACETIGIEEHGQTMLTIHPNPTDNGSITITLENPLNLHLTCFNTFGQEVQTEEVFGVETVINVSDWSPGIYLAVVYEDGQPVGRVKFIVQ